MWLLEFTGDNGGARVRWDLELGPRLLGTQALSAISLNLFSYIGFIKMHFASSSLNSYTLNVSGAACRLHLNKTDEEKNKAPCFHGRPLCRLEVLRSSIGRTCAELNVT